MIVRLYLGQDMRHFLHPAVSTIAPRPESHHLGARKNRGIVGIGDDAAFRMRGMRFTDHVEQGFLTRRAINYPRGIKNFVSAMFGIGLRKHHQLDISRIAPRLIGEQIKKVVDLIAR